MYRSIPNLAAMIENLNERCIKQLPTTKQKAEGSNFILFELKANVGERGCVLKTINIADHFSSFII